MKHSTYIALIFISLLILIQNLTCGDEEIEHCLECGTGKEADSCAKCEEKYFPFLSNVLCLPCDHHVYGQVGCGGKCEKKNYVEQRMVFCEETGCKEGYYNIEGICYQCATGSDFCIKCKYEPPNGLALTETDERIFTCLECINNQFRIESDGRCHPCHVNHCQICHYENNNAVCDRCYYGYYLNSAKTCSSCYYTYPTGGRCYICSSNPLAYNTGYCYCYTGYTESKFANGIKEPCIPCPQNCAYCSYNPKTQAKKCYSCYRGLTLNSKGVCVSCGEHCSYCYLDSNENPICTVCDTGHRLNDDRNCLIRPEHCSSCIKNSKGEILCTSCYSYYGVNPEKRCVSCPAHCIHCFWKSSTNSFGCSYCEKYYSYSYQQNYIEGKNDTCIRCQDIEEIGGNGCIQCYYDKYRTKEYKKIHKVFRRYKRNKD